MEKFEFLKEIENIVNQYEKEKSETSVDYNLFSLLSRESDEVLTHSAIIADLLDPRGKHGLGNAPLGLFVNLIDIPLFDLDGVQSFKEMPIGKINEDSTEGGRIDIYVKNGRNQAFLIENKIFATEQKNQLLRYYNFAPESTILYLTLDGESSKAEELKFYYKFISYKTNII
ncbi:MAG: PD-(D/E)XK nuclease family protein, partial [Bacteroidetes bacterium]|nr:PD-(D/E)XK nuclease family protein [Bacteroidota bacterium]